MVRVFHYAVYLIYLALESVLRFIPLWLCSIAGSWLGFFAYFIMPGYRHTVKRNLTIAFGDEMGPSQTSRLAHKHFIALGRNMLSSLKLSTMRTSSVERRVKYEGQEIARKVIEEGKGGIAAIMHMGPWELLSQIPSFGPGAKKATLYQPLENPILNRHLVDSRAQEGVILFDRRKGFYGPMKHLREGGGLGVLIDQHAGNSGVWCPFFGRLASTTNLASLFCIRTGAPIVPIGLFPIGIAKWKIIYGEPIRGHDADGNEISTSKLTAQLNLAIEKLIRRAPEEWFWVHNRWKTPSPEFMLSGYRRGIEYPDDFDKSTLKPFRILVRSPNWLGDACMAVPTVRAIKRGREDATVTVLCPENLAELWRAVLDVDHVIPMPRKASVFRASALIQQTSDFDAGILFPNSLRTALEMKLAGIPHIAGYAGHSRVKLLDQVVPESRIQGPPEHHAWRYMRIAKHVGADSTDPDLYATRKQGLDFNGRWRIGICPGAAYGDAKRWPVDRFARSVEELHRKLGEKVDWIVYGAPNELGLANQFEKECKVAVDNKVGQTTITELMDDLSLCHLLISNDTGTMHLAALLGVKTVAIFGSTEPKLTGPLGKGHRVLRHQVECSPCFLRDCPLDFRCMTSIQVSDVVQASLALLEEQRGPAGELTPVPQVAATA